MTRSEEIDKIASAFAIDEVKDTCNPASKRGLLYVGFITGAEWADTHPDIDVRTMAAWQSGYNEGIAKPSWISVEEIQPKEDEWFLGYSPLKSPLSSMEIDVYNFNSNGLIEAHGITHWMPLPAPPKNGGELIPRNELCKHYRSWVGTSKGEINCACVDEETRTITKCDYTESKGCWKCPKTTKEGGEE